MENQVESWRSDMKGLNTVTLGNVTQPCFMEILLHIFSVPFIISTSVPPREPSLLPWNCQDRRKSVKFLTFQNFNVSSSRHTFCKIFLIFDSHLHLSHTVKCTVVPVFVPEFLPTADSGNLVWVQHKTGRNWRKPKCNFLTKDACDFHT